MKDLSKGNFMNAVNVCAFAYPENSGSRGVIENLSNTLTFSLDLTSNPVPEGAGIAIIFDKNHPAPKTGRLKINFISKNPDQVTLFMELKGQGKEVYQKYEVEDEDDFAFELKEDTTELVFCTFKSISHNCYSKILITYIES